MLAAFLLTTARNRCWWSHCRSLESPDISMSFFVRLLKKGVANLPYSKIQGHIPCEKPLMPRVLMLLFTYATQI